MLFFSIPTSGLAFVLLAICVASAGTGLFLGRRAHARSEALKEPFAVLQAAMLGFMGLVLALFPPYTDLSLTVTFDLDRPTRGAITVADTPLVALRASMGRTS